MNGLAKPIHPAHTVQESAHDVIHGHVQWGAPSVVGDRGVGAVLEQSDHDVLVAPVRCTMQRRVPVLVLQVRHIRDVDRFVMDEDRKNATLHKDEHALHKGNKPTIPMF
jgi:hypothetical protein